MPLSIITPPKDNFCDETECPIISKKTGEFKLTPVCLSPSNPKSKYDQFCNVKVVVEEKEYSHQKGKPHWYYISYEYEFIGKKSGKTKKIDNSFKHPSNPFFGMPGAAEEYEGTIILVSHDRHFLKELAEKVYEIDKNKVTIYPGNYDYYLSKTQN